MTLMQHRVIVNGVSIHYMENAMRSASSQSILFLHGWPLSSLAFRASLKHLARKYHIIAPDLPGFGGSAYASSLHNYEAFSQLIFDFLTTLGISEINVVGHSTGGGIALMMAYKYPTVVRKLILLDSAGIPLKDGVAQIILRKPLALIAQTWNTKFSLDHIPLLAATLWNTTVRFQTAWKISAIPLREDLRPIFPYIQTPCLIIWGKNDRTIPLAYGAEMSKQIPGVQFSVVENGYHEWSALKPKTLSAFVSDFIE